MTPRAASTNGSVTPLLEAARRLPLLIARLPSPSWLVLLFAGLFAGWWVYVPIHELLHVAGCLWTGGEVSELQIAGAHGGPLFERIFPFVVAGSDYAGRLSGFDTHGSDWIYQATVLMPYLITVFPGLWLWWRLLDPRVVPTPLRTVAVGALLPVVAAPLISLGGDYYESASIIISRLFAASAGRELDAWRSDDVFRLIGEWPGGLAAVDYAAIGAGLVLALLLALFTLWLGAWLAARLDPSTPEVK